MGRQEINVEEGRKTSADVIFDHLFGEIVSLRLVPGTKLSEGEVAKKSDVSRQPVREAFIRLNNLKLLQVRPQRATVVRKISITEILNSRFIRTAVEVEVVRKACREVSAADLNAIGHNLKQQAKAAKKHDSDQFHLLDYEFHRLICVAANSEFANETIAENKAQVDRLCMLNLANREALLELVEDHSAIFEALKNRDADRMVELTRKHLSRLDETLRVARQTHSAYFED